MICPSCNIRILSIEVDSEEKYNYYICNNCGVEYYFAIKLQDELFDLKKKYKKQFEIGQYLDFCCDLCNNSYYLIKDYEKMCKMKSFW